MTPTLYILCLVFSFFSKPAKSLKLCKYLAINVIMILIIKQQKMQMPFQHLCLSSFILKSCLYH